jgi:hypothetical protein
VGFLPSASTVSSGRVTRSSNRTNSAFSADKQINIAEFGLKVLPTPTQDVSSKAIRIFAEMTKDSTEIRPEEKKTSRAKSRQRSASPRKANSKKRNGSDLGSQMQALVFNVKSPGSAFRKRSDVIVR